MSHTWMSHGPHMNESRPSYECVMIVRCLLFFGEGEAIHM